MRPSSLLKRFAKPSEVAAVIAFACTPLVFGGKNLPYASVLTAPSIPNTIRFRMAHDLERNDWIRAARLALLRGGVEAVRVERLARDLHVTKGSFYWHFKDREELLDLLLREWEQELSEDIIPRLRGLRGRKALLSLVRMLVKRVPLGEQGRLPSDGAIFAWAAVSPEVAQRVNCAERERIRLLKHIVGDSHLVEMLYLVWLGFVARGQREPGSRKSFPRVASMMLELSSPARRNRPRRTSRV
jgi:AcrR family transcriptional regulator